MGGNVRDGAWKSKKGNWLEMLNLLFGLKGKSSGQKIQPKFFKKKIKNLGFAPFFSICEVFFLSYKKVKN